MGIFPPDPEVVYPELTTLFRFRIVGLLIVARLVLVVKLDVLMIFLGPFRDILTTNHRIHEGKESIGSRRKRNGFIYQLFSEWQNLKKIQHCQVFLQI